MTAARRVESSDVAEPFRPWVSALVESASTGELCRFAVAGSLAATVAHEVRNALACAQANLEYLQAMVQDRHSAESELVSASREASEGVAQALAASANVLNLARGQQVEAQAVDVARIAQRAVGMFSLHAEGVRLEMALDLVPAARAEPRGLLQVLLNLLLNAAEAAGQGGRVRISTSVDSSFVHVDVCDSGPGLAPDMLERLFDPFRSGRGSQGAGVGLALSRAIVASFGGDITAGQGQLGGALFSVRLPLAARVAKAG